MEGSTETQNPDTNKENGTTSAPADDPSTSDQPTADPEPTTTPDTTTTPEPTDTPDTTVTPEAVPNEVTDEEPAETEATVTPEEDGIATLVEEEEVVYNVYIENYAALKRDVEFGVVKVDGSAVTDAIDNNGNIAVTSTAGTAKTLALTLTAKTGRTIVVKFDGEVVEVAAGVYSKSIAGDTNVTIEVAETYDLTVTDNTSDTLTVKRFVYTNEGEQEVGLTSNAAMPKDGEDLRFYTSYTQTDGEKLVVSYAVDGETDEKVLTGETVTNPATGSGQIVLYTIPADVISRAESLVITLAKNETKAVKISKDSSAVSKVEVWKDKTEGGETFKDWVAVDNDTENSVIAGETVRFRATLKDGYKINKLQFDDGNGAADVTVPFDGEAYEYTVEEAGTITFVTEIDPDQSRVLTFKLSGAKDSAKIYISKLTPKAEDGTAGTPTTDAGEIKTALGDVADIDTTTDSSKAYVAVDKGINIPADVYSIDITTAASTGYEITRVNGTDVAEADNAGKEYAGILFDSIGDFEVETQAEAAAAATYFKISNLTPATSHVKVTIEAGEVGDETSPIVKTATTASDGLYRVNAKRTATFTITADEGYALKTDANSFLGKIKAVVAGGEVESAVVDNKVVYTVNLLAAKLGTDSSPTDLTGGSTGAALETEIRTFAETVDAENSSDGATYDASAFTSTQNASFAGTDNDASAIPYKAKVVHTIVAADKYVLTGVSYTTGGKTEEAEILVSTDNTIVSEAGKTYATIEIPEVTDDITLKITTAKKPVLDLTDDSDNPVTPDGDGIYLVQADEKYKVTADPAFESLTKVTAEIKEGDTVIGNGKKISGELQVWMDKTWSGKDLTVDVKDDGVSVGQLLLQVEKNRTTLEVNGGGPIEQAVGTTQTYEIDTDGEVLETATINFAGTGAGPSALATKLNNTAGAATIENGKLKLAVPALKDNEVNEVTLPAKDVEGSRKPYTVTMQVKDDASGLFTKVPVTLNAVLDTTSKPSVSPVANGVSDTTIHVNVGMSDVNTPDAGKGKVYYIVTATAEANKPAANGEPAQNRDNRLVQSVTEIKERTGDSQSVELKVSASDLGAVDASWTYNVTAKAVYALNGTEPTASVASDANNDVSIVSDASSVTTKDTYFEASLKLKKEKGSTTTFYTGQTGEWYVATPTFTQNTTYQITEATVEDLTGTKNAERVKATVKNGKLYVTEVPVTAPLGKHTLRVTAKADETTNHVMYAARANIDVTVVKGIESLSIDASASLFKQSGKSATLAPKVVYNYDVKKNQPKTKKVNWYVGGVGTTGKDSLKPAPAGVTINQKNGKVTVAKDFVLDTRRPNNNKFVIVAEAADYSGVTREAVKTITITDKAMDLSNLVIAKSDGSKMKIVAVQESKGMTVKPADIHGAKVYALNTRVSVGSVSTDKWDALGGNELLAASASFSPTGDKNKTINVNANGYISVKQAGKKATIKVTAKDGSKKSGSITLNLDYEDMPNNTAALEIKYKGIGKTEAALYSPVKETDAADVAKSYEVPGVAELTVNVKKAQLRSTGNAFQRFVNASGYENYKLTTKGGKQISDGNGRFTIYTTAKETTLTLTAGKGKDAKKYTYKLTNTAYNAGTTPKATLKGSLFEKDAAPAQTLELTVLNGKDVFGDNMYAKVEVDQTTWTAKNAEALYKLEQALDGNNIVKLDKATGKADLTFTNTDVMGDGYAFNAGSYKLKVTVGTGGTAAAFKAQTLPATVSVKVAKNKKFTFKPQTTYTLSKSEGAVLTGKGSNGNEGIRTNFQELQNNNKKGKSNNFTHYFTIETDAKTKAQYLTWNLADEKVKDLFYEYTVASNGKKTYSNKLKENPDLSSISKDDLVGYVKYTVEAKKMWYQPYELKDQYAKITVKIAKDSTKGKVKAVQKFATPSNTEVKAKKGNTTSINLTVNGSYVSVVSAVIDDSAKGNSLTELTLAKNAVNANGQIVLEAANNLDTTKKAGYTINLLVVPAGSHYANVIAATSKKEDKEALTKKYGIPVKVTVKASATAKDSTVPSDQLKEVVPVTLESIKTEVKNAVESSGIQVLRNDANTSGYVDAADATSKASAIDDVVEDALAAYDGEATASMSAGLTRASATAVKATIAYSVTYNGQTDTVECQIDVNSDVEKVEITTPVADGNQTANVTCVAKVTMKDGSSNTTDVKWSATGGTINATTGEVTIQQAASAQTIVVTATSTRDSSKTTTRTITVPAQGGEG